MKQSPKGKTNTTSLKELNIMFYNLIVKLEKNGFRYTRKAAKCAYEVFMEEITSKLNNP